MELERGTQSWEEGQGVSGRYDILNRMLRKGPWKRKPQSKKQELVGDSGQKEGELPEGVLWRLERSGRSIEGGVRVGSVQISVKILTEWKSLEGLDRKQLIYPCFAF